MTEQLPIDVRPRSYRLRVEDFLLLDRSGVFDGLGRTELIDGEVLLMNAQHRPHARVKTRLGYALDRALAGHAFELLIEPSVAMPPHDAPEPDLVVTDEPHGEGLVPLRSVALIVEVSGSTLPFDRNTKAALYARHGVPEYWVADVNARLVHQMWDAAEGAYRSARTIAFGQPLSAATLADLTVATDDL